MAVPIDAAVLRQRMKEREWNEIDVSARTRVSPSSLRNIFNKMPVSIELALNLCEGMELPLAKVSPEAYKRFLRVGTHESYT